MPLIDDMTVACLSEYHAHRLVAHLPLSLPLSEFEQVSDPGGGGQCMGGPSPSPSRSRERFRCRIGAAAASAIHPARQMGGGGRAQRWSKAAWHRVGQGKGGQGSMTQGEAGQEWCRGHNILTAKLASM